MQNPDFDPLDLHDLVGHSDMTLGEMITSFRQAKDRRLQLHALAELTLLPEEEVKDLLLSHGVSYKEFPRAPRKKHPVELPDPTAAPAAKPARKTKASPPPPKKFNRSRPRLCRLRRCLAVCAACSPTGTSWPRSWPKSMRSSTRCVGCLN